MKRANFRSFLLVSYIKRIKIGKFLIIKIKEKIMNRNYSIKCDVKECAHNAEGCNCSLDCVKITCGCDEHCTCCDSFNSKK